jgi:hypothetical protein
MPTYTWEPWGAMFNSVAYASSETTYLSVNYSDGVDTRWPNKAIKGPQFTALELTTTFGGTAANANAAVMAKTADGTDVLYVARGTDPAKFKLSDLTLLDPAISAAARINSLAIINTAAGAQQIAYGITGANDYRVVTVSANSGSDTTAANTAGQDAEFIAVAPDSMVVMNKQQVYRNIISGAVTAAAPSLNSVNSSAPLPNLVTFTGFETLGGNQWIVGTNVGPYGVNQQFGRFDALFPGLPVSADNCRAMTKVEWLGGAVLIPLEGQLRLQTPGGGMRVGPEAYLSNTSPIRGIVMGAWRDPNWYICAMLNRQTGTYYFLAARPRQDEDTRAAKPILWYCIGSTTTACELVYTSGTTGGRTLPAWWFGAADDVLRMDAGRTDVWIDDSSYTFSTTTQNLYLTELRVSPRKVLRLKRIDLEVGGCAAGTRSVTVYWTGDSGTETKIATFDRDGARHFIIPDYMGLRASRVKFRLEFVSNSTTVSPYTDGALYCDFEEMDRNPETFAEETSVARQRGW